MTSLLELQKDWEGFAQTNPLWSICTDPEKRDQQWDIQEFFETGKNQTRCIDRKLRSIFGRVSGLEGPGAFLPAQQTGDLHAHLGGELLQVRPDLRIVFMSGYPNDQLNRPDAAFLPKPFNPASLSRMVRKELDRPAAVRRNVKSS